MTRRVCCNSICIVATVGLLSACAEPQPHNINNACELFTEKKSWRTVAIDVQERWNIPMEVTLAFIHQESSFKSQAKPPRRKLFGIIPWFGRVSSASGYSQAIDSTWSEYKAETGRWYARRSSFKYAADFVGWYNHKSVKELRLSPNDAYSLYLAYHEGRRGYQRKTYTQKPWLLNTANKVKRRAATYRKQLLSCPEKPRGWFARLIFFDLF